MGARAATLAAALVGAAALAAPTAGAHRPRTETQRDAVPSTLGLLARLGGSRDTLIQLTRSRAFAAAPLLRGAGAELVSDELSVWRVSRQEASSLVPLLQLVNAVRAVEPDRVLHRPENHLTAGDPLVPDEYWLARVGADLAEPPGPGKAVTVVDTGLDASHPEFAGRPQTVLLNPQHVLGEDDDHGTTVASVVGAQANGVGLVGVYPQALVQAWDASPRGDAELTVADEVRGILAAAARGPGVINLSLGSDEFDGIEEDAVLTAFRRGSIIVASAGNEFQQGNPIEYPASLNHVLTVAATNQQDEPAYFSSASRSIDLAAPGEAIPIAEPLQYRASGYGVESGTSYSAPIVAGATAWVWTERPDLDNTQVFELMRRSSRDVWDPGFDEDTGFGLLSIPAALSRTAPAPDPKEPNDDIDQVKPSGLFKRGADPINSPSHTSAALRARLDASEDPDDVYRVYLPPGRSIVVYVSADRDVDLDLWGLGTQSVFEKGKALRRDLLASSGRSGKRRELLRYLNRGRRGIVLYADVFLGEGTRSATYALSVTSVTSGAPR